MRRWTGRCYLYVMTFAQSARIIAKVGTSNNPKKRVKEVQTGCPFQICGLYVVEFSSRDAACNAEFAAHGELSDYRQAGEWFSFPAHNVEVLFAAIGRVSGGRELERISIGQPFFSRAGAA